MARQGDDRPNDGKLRDGVMKRGGTWSYVVRVPDPVTGKSKPKWVGGYETEKAAKAARDEARRSARRGEYVEKSRITVEEYMTGWLDGHAMVIKASTLASYREWMARYVYPRVGGMRLQAVRPARLTAMYRDLLESGSRRDGPLSARSVRYVHAILHKALNDAVHVDRLLETNPCDGAKRPRKDVETVGAVWTAGELRRFLVHASSHRLFAIFRLLAYSGARRGELLFLRWSDVDWKGSKITIRGTAGMVGGKRSEGTPKSGRQREVSLDPETMEILRQHKKRQLVECETAGQAWAKVDYAFTTALGMPVPPDTVTNLFGVLIRQYNQPAVPGTRKTPRRELPRPANPLPHLRLHDLRHTHATLLLLAGVPVHVVSERLGHSDPAITLRIYAHVLRRHAEGVAGTFAAAVDQDEDDGPETATAAPC